MRSAVWLAWTHVRAHFAQTVVLFVCFAVAVALPVLTRMVTSEYRDALERATAQIPAIVGEKGSRFDLVFAGAMLEPLREGSVPLFVYEDMLKQGRSAIPMVVRDTAGGRPVVATTFEYFARMGLSLEQGDHFVTLGDAVLGSRAAAALNVAPGDHLSTDQRRSFDVTSAPSIRLNVVGVLTPSGGPADDAVFIDLETAWVLEGFSHAHTDAANVEGDGFVLGKSEEHIGLSNALAVEQQITPDNVANFHAHGERGRLPLTAVLLFDIDQKQLTILTARLRETSPYQLVRPGAVAQELITRILRSKAILDAISVVVAVSTLALVATIVVLAYRLRRAEIRTLSEIGCPRATLVTMFAFETFGVLVAAGLIGIVIALVVSPFATSIAGSVLRLSGQAYATGSGAETR